MKKVYIARRIPKDPLPYFVLDVCSSMTVDQIHSLYVRKIFTKRKYIYNGPWILRPPVSESGFSSNRLPPELKPHHVWNMVKEKIEASDVILGIVNNKAYGTIAEVGYACNNKKAVYVLPDTDVSEDELQDLWFIFQIARSTKYLWSDGDISDIDEFSKLNINNLQEYENFIDSIVPNFIKK